MLKIMRKHAGWGLKVVLSVIIVTFVFFFGFNKVNEQNLDSVALVVGSQSVPLSQFRFFYENQYEKLREQFKGGEIPEFLTKSIKQSVQQQLVTSSLIEQFSTQLGFKVTDQELANFISSEKDFDPVSYKNFINNFYYRYGFAYEDMVRNDLLVKKFQEWAQNTEKISEPPLQPTWTFETITITDAGKKEIAEAIQETWFKGSEATALLKKEKLKTEKMGPLGLKDRKKIFGGALTVEEYASLLSLKKPKSGITKPFVKENKWMAVRLVEQKNPEANTPQNNGPSYLPQLRLVDYWFRDFADKTPVQSLVKSEGL